MNYSWVKFARTVANREYRENDPPSKNVRYTVQGPYLEVANTLVKNQTAGYCREAALALPPPP